MAHDAATIREIMRNAGVTLPDPPAPASASEAMTCDSLGLTTGELRFAKRLGVSPERYAANKSIRSLTDWQALHHKGGE